MSIQNRIREQRPAIDENTTLYRSLIGRKIELLTIKNVQSIGKTARGSNIYFYVCDCDCGKKDVLKRCSAVKRGMCTSCGCRRDQYDKIAGKNSKCFVGHEGISGQYWGVIKQSASARHHEFNLSIQEAWQLYQKQNGLSKNK